MLFVVVVVVSLYSLHFTGSELCVFFPTAFGHMEAFTAGGAVSNKVAKDCIDQTGDQHGLKEEN